MKAIFIAIIYAVNLWFSNKGVEQPQINVIIPAQGIDTTYFKTRVQPILQKNCSPCHFPGGKQYEKLPFDKAETIIDHAPAALKRFKDENEMILIREFIQQEKLIH